jgi:branched-chain amino acid aminotransferase
VPFIWIADPEKQERGLHAVIGSKQRIAPESVDPTVKNYHWLDLETGLLESYEQGGETVILVDAEDNVVEGPGFNVFAVANGTISTPDRGVLEGITRKTIIELAAEHDIHLAARPVPADELRQADEVFLSSTAGGVIPITTVDGEAVCNGEPGPLTRQLREAYWELHDDPRFSLPVRYD